MRIELHCHTNHSDGLPSVEQLVRKANKTLDAVVITDHNTMTGYKEAKKMEKDFLLVPGVEVHASYVKKTAHVTVIGSEFVPYRKYVDVLELIDNAHACGAVAINVHPFGGLFRPGFTEKELVRKFDAIEIINGMTFNALNRKAARLAQELDMNTVAGSDAHVLKMLGSYACEIDGDGVDDVVKAIKKGRVKLPEARTKASRIFATQVSRKLYTKLGLTRKNNQSILPSIEMP